MKKEQRKLQLSSETLQELENMRDISGGLSCIIFTCSFGGCRTKAGC